jgi:hypothetical protein
LAQAQVYPNAREQFEGMGCFPGPIHRRLDARGRGIDVLRSMGITSLRVFPLLTFSGAGEKTFRHGSVRQCRYPPLIGYTFLLFFALVAVWTVGCSVPADFAAAERASYEFHQEMASGQYAAIYDRVTDTFKAGTGRNDFVEFCKRVNRKMGACAVATITAKNFQRTPQGSFVSLTYTLGCANGELSEQLEWRFVNGRAFLNRLNVNSSLLLVDQIPSTVAAHSHNGTPGLADRQSAESGDLGPF